MTIAVLTGRLLQSFEFFRSGAGRWAVLFFEKLVSPFKWTCLPLMIWGIIKLSLSVFRLFCSAIRDHLTTFENLNQITREGGAESADILAIANTVFPVNEFVSLLVAWVGLYTACASIRFLRPAWAAIPLKAT